MLNNITIGGRFVRDPETRMTQQQKPVTTFTLACERDFAPQGQDAIDTRGVFRCTRGTGAIEAFTCGAIGTMLHERHTDGIL